MDTSVQGGEVREASAAAGAPSTGGAPRYRRKRGKRGGVRRAKPFSRLTLAEREALYDRGLRRAEQAAMAKIALPLDDRGRLKRDALLACPSAARLPTELLVDFHSTSASRPGLPPQRSTSDDDAFGGLISSDEDDDNTFPPLTEVEIQALRAPVEDALETAPRDVLVGTVTALRTALRKFITAYANRDDELQEAVRASSPAEDPALVPAAAAARADDVAHAGVKRARVAAELEDPTEAGR